MNKSLLKQKKRFEEKIKMLDKIMKIYKQEKYSDDYIKMRS